MRAPALSAFPSLRRLSHLGLALAVLATPAVSRAESPPVDVVIVGAGLAGLSTAYRLKKAGLTYEIVELSPHIGGRIRTASYTENVSGEVGLEEFWQGNPTIEIMEELKLPRERSATSFSSFLDGGKVRPFQQETNREFLRANFSKQELAAYDRWDKKMAQLYKLSAKRPLPPELLQLKDVSFGAWVRKESGLPQRLQEFVRLESEPEYATSWEAISALDGVLEWHIFSGEGSNSVHVVGGNQLLPAAIAKSVGVEHVTLNTKVTRIESTDEGVRVTGIDQGSYQERVFRGRYVVTTLPLFRLMELQFVPPLSEDRKGAIMTQTWGAYFTAHVVLDKGAAGVMGAAADALPILSDGPLGVIYGDKPAAGEEHMLLNLLICGGHAERFNLRAITAMDSVRKELTEAFEKQWPGLAQHIEKFEFYQYHPRAIAGWPVGRSRLDAAADLFRTPQGRVYFAGDFTEGTHSDGAAISAVRVVENIVKQSRAGKAAPVLRSTMP